MHFTYLEIIDDMNNRLELSMKSDHSCLGRSGSLFEMTPWIYFKLKPSN